MEQKNSKISPIKNRILQFIEYKGITKSNFCELTGISYSNLNSKSLESEIVGSQLMLISSKFNEISLDWLILGKGNMLREGVVRSAEEERMELLQEVIETQRKTIELLEDRVSALEEEVARYTEGEDAVAG